MGVIEWLRNYALSKGYAEQIDDSYDDDDDYDDSYDDDEREERTSRYSSRDARDRDREKDLRDRERSALFEDTKRTPFSSYYTGSTGRIPSTKVVSIHTNVQFTVVLSNPESLDEAGTVCDLLKTNKTVVVNLENVKHDEAQRIVDFLGGVVFALEGDIQYISNKIFVIAPKNVEITGELKDDIEKTGLLASYKTTFK